MPLTNTYKLLYGLLFVGVWVLCSACHLQVGENVYSQSVITEKDFSTGCLNNIDTVIDDYLAGKNMKKRGDKIFKCIKKSLITFKNHVHGKNKGEFTPYELRKFIHDFIMQDRKINNKLLYQLAILKTMIVGGTVHKLTSSDIDRFIEFLHVFKNEVLFLQDHVRALYNMDNTLYLKKNHTQITLDFMQSLNRLSVFLKQFAKPYSFKNMQTLIKELDLIINNQINIPKLSQKIKAISIVKKFIVHGSSTVIQPHEWQNFLLGASYLMNVAIHYACLKRQKKFISLKSMYTLNLLANQLTKFLSQSVRSHPQGTIQEAELMRMALYLQSAKVIPSYFRPLSLKRFLKITFGKAFNVHKKNYGIVELNRDRVNKIQQVTNDWLALQLTLNKVIRNRSLGVNQQVNYNIIPLPATSMTYAVFNTISYIKQLFTLKPLSQKQGWKIHVSHQVYQPLFMRKHTYRILTTHHLYRFLLEIVRLGYQKNKSPNLKLTQKELTAFFTDLNPIAEDMGWFEQVTSTTSPSTLGMGELEFILAKTVVPSTKGYNTDWNKTEYITTQEMMEYLSYSISISSSLQEIEPIVSKLCSYKAGGKYNLSCVSKHLLSILTNTLPNIPDFQKAVLAMDAKKKETFTQSLIHIAFETQKGYDTAKYLTRWRLKNILMAVYFIETIFNRFDKNVNFILEHEEIWDAFPLFHGFLNRTVVYDLNWPEAVSLTPDLYAYVIYYKQLTHQARHTDMYKGIHDKIDEAAIFSHQLWRKHPEWQDKLAQFPGTNWTLRMDREHLVRVFSAVIKGFMSNTLTDSTNSKVTSPSNTDNPDTNNNVIESFFAYLNNVKNKGQDYLSSLSNQKDPSSHGKNNKQGTHHNKNCRHYLSGTFCN